MNLAEYKPTLSEVAALVGKSSRWCAELRSNGALPPDGATLGEFITAWTKNAAGTAKGKSTDASMRRLSAAQADMAEMKVGQMQRELLPRMDVEAAVQNAFARVRGKLLGLPARSAPIIAPMKSAVAVQEKLTELVHEALAELAETQIVPPAEAAADSVPADAGGGGVDGVDGGPMVSGDEAATAADRKPMGRRKPAPKPRSKRGARKVGHKPG